MEVEAGGVERRKVVEVGKHGKRQQEKDILSVTVVKVEQQRHQANAEMNKRTGHDILSF